MGTRGCFESYWTRARAPRLSHRCKMSRSVFDRTTAMTAITAKRPKSRRTSSDTTPAPKTTAYGRDVLRVLKEMRKLGPWEFGPRISDRIFRK